MVEYSEQTKNWSTKTKHTKNGRDGQNLPNLGGENWKINREPWAVCIYVPIDICLHKWRMYICMYACMYVCI